MNQSLKSVLALIVLVTLGVGVLGWTTRGLEGVDGSQFWMRSSLLLCAPALALLAWGDFRKDKAPDYLKGVSRAYFERDGLCFVVRPALLEGDHCWLIFFQNRYAKPCHAAIGFRPSVPPLGVFRPKLDEVRLEIDCPGGAFGFVRVPYRVPSNEQGRKRWFELSAVNHYPEGRGTRLRFRDGMRVGRHHKSGLDTALMVASGLVGHLHYTRSARFKAQLPISPGPSGNPVPRVTTQILWTPADPVRPFDELVSLTPLT